MRYILTNMKKNLGVLTMLWIDFDKSNIERV